MIYVATGTVVTLRRTMVQAMAAGLAGVTGARVLWSLKEVRSRGFMLEVCEKTLYVVRWTGVYVLLHLNCSTTHVEIHITTCSDDITCTCWAPKQVFVGGTPGHHTAAGCTHTAGSEHALECLVSNSPNGIADRHLCCPFFHINTR